MIKWVEVFRDDLLSDGRVVKEKLAALIVSDEPDGGLATLASLKETYGTDAIYQWHYCEHDDGRGCSTESD